MGHYVYVRNKKTQPGHNGLWGDKKKIEAVTTYLATGNYSLTSKMINVPLPTIHIWKTQDWWKQMVEDVYQEGNLQLNTKLTKILEKSIDAVNDRLQNGDYVYNPKTDSLVRIPPKLRDVHRVTSDLIDKQMILRKQKVEKQETEESRQDILKKLAEEFAKFALGQGPSPVKPAEVVEGEFTDLPNNYQEAEERNV